MPTSTAAGISRKSQTTLGTARSRERRRAGAATALTSDSEGCDRNEAGEEYGLRQAWPGGARTAQAYSQLVYGVSSYTKHSPL
jgi:hypothetical protein